MALRPLPSPSPNNPQIREYTEAARRGLNAYFVIKTENGWSVRKPKATKPSFVTSNKSEAIKQAKDIAKDHKSEVYVFDEDGRLTADQG